MLLGTTRAFLPNGISFRPTAFAACTSVTDDIHPYIACYGNICRNKTKYLPVLYYALEACPLNKSEIKAPDYVLFSSFSKILHTKSKDVVDQCMLLFRCPFVLTVINKRKAKFLTDYVKSCNSLCRLFGHAAQNEVKDLQSCTRAAT